MKEWEKAQQGYLYDANYDEDIVERRLVCGDLCYEYNLCRPTDTAKQQELIAKIFQKELKDPVITAPFYCDYGTNIQLGANFYSNHNLVILDGAPVIIGDYVFIAPNCVITTAGHALDKEQRAAGLEIAKPITIGNYVWIGANVSILPGVTIGDGTIIGANSVVNKDIPAGVVAAGVPCKVIRKITEADKNAYPIWNEQ